MLLKAAKELQSTKPPSAIQAIYNELPDEEKSEFVELLDSHGIPSSVVARALRQSNLSPTANKLTENGLAESVRRHRRGETQVKP